GGRATSRPRGSDVRRDRQSDEEVLRGSVGLWPVAFSVSVSLWRVGGLGSDALALGNPAAAAAGARGEVSTVPGPDAAERPAGGRRAAPRAAGRQHAFTHSRRRLVRSQREARSRAAGGVAPGSGDD